MGKPKCEKKCEKKIVKKGKAKWKRMLDELKEQKNFFINNYNRTIDESTKWMIEFIVRNFEKFIRRNKSHCDYFKLMMLKSGISLERMEQATRICFGYSIFMEREFIMYFLILNAEVLRIELQNSLTDMRYRYPRCSHFKMRVTHSLFVKPFHYLESTDKDYVRFICDDCKKNIYFFVELWDEYSELDENIRDEIHESHGGCIGINYESFLGLNKILGFMSVTPLNFSMY